MVQQMFSFGSNSVDEVEDVQSTLHPAATRKWVWTTMQPDICLYQSLKPD